MNNDSLSLKLFVILSKTYRVIMEQAVKDMKRHGFSETEFAMLELLYHKGKIPMQQLSEKLLITSGGITYTADKLENKGLLRRVACPSDRRVTYAEITEEGSEMFHDVFPEHQKVIESTMTGLTDEEKREAIDLLKKLGLSAQNT
ncbi:MarR family transcriptional regulator [Paenibacillus polygoni]|uniref:MarR family transcriptional regulator n=1 Tax=Paenibacillus polygoni TaxID=3050112 RepID=A0ABY8X2P5_9BACL|nr:MarR family transcriptional regulator [Paenibacillus polygoni]WIV18751.1 MarR family transcriptional regulator [Paenibacillus polygoni]